MGNVPSVPRFTQSLKNLAQSLTGAMQNPNLSSATRKLFTDTLTALNNATSMVEDLKNNQ